jgi:BirA family biotin operon repressor/biotin-[acetyl-CoA-carboxylase] ligase
LNPEEKQKQREVQSAHKMLHTLGHDIIAYREVSSTNIVAATLAQTGAKDGTIVSGAYQTAGSGRLSRSWHSPPGTGITMSLIVQATKENPIAAQYMLLAAVAVANSVEDVLGLNVGIKWPNDVLIDGRKICGILAQASTLPGGRGYAVIGIGINVNQAETDFDVEYRDRSTSLQIVTKKRVSRMKLIRAFLRAWDTHMVAFRQNGYAYIREKWIEKNITLGATITVSSNGEIHQGTAEDVLESGALVVRLENNEIKELLSEEISLGKKYYR